MRLITLGIIAINVVVIIAVSFLWLLSDFPYIDVGTGFLGMNGFGIGLYQGKIFYSTVVTFFVCFLVAFYYLSEVHEKGIILSLLTSAMLVISGAYVFEFFYLIFNHFLLPRYIIRLGWLFNLLSGFMLIFFLDVGRFTKLSAAMLGILLVMFGVWFLSGFPQLKNKEYPVSVYPNYTGLSKDYALLFNASTKLVACLFAVSLVAHRGQRKDEL